MKSPFNLILFVILLFSSLNCLCQDRKTLNLEKTLNSSRIENANYRLLMFNQNKDDISGVTIVQRTISREVFNSRNSIKITEINKTSNPSTKTVIYIDVNNLKPLYYESSSNNIVTQKATFEGDKLVVTDISNGAEKKNESLGFSGSYFSNSFSELVQANDFSKNSVIKFETFTPGKPKNQFLVERVGEKEFMTPDGQKMDCWVLKFTRIDGQGVESLAGYRFVDKKHGKVVLYKSDLNSENYFTYQIIFLNEN